MVTMSLSFPRPPSPPRHRCHHLLLICIALGSGYPNLTISPFTYIYFCPSSVQEFPSISFLSPLVHFQFVCMLEVEYTVCVFACTVCIYIYTHIHTILVSCGR